MEGEGEVSLKLFGLAQDKELVRADVFARKFSAFVNGLAAADKMTNGKRLHTFVITELKESSALVKVREKQRTRERPCGSSIRAYTHAINAVYAADKAAERLPPKLLKNIKKLGTGVAEEFAHGEVTYDADNVIRIDDFLLRQSDAVLAEVVGPSYGKKRFFRGKAIGSFDGTLQVMDARGTALRAKLFTTAGSVEIDCVLNKDRVPEARLIFGERVRIEGTAHYDGEHQLPVRLDINSIWPLKSEPDLRRWRGSLRNIDQREDW